MGRRKKKQKPASGCGRKGWFYRVSRPAVAAKLCSGTDLERNGRKKGREERALKSRLFLFF
jgi:hypothetical protein